MQVKIGDIKPNPFRNMERYPVDRQKVDALRESMRATGFWDNMVARKVGKRVEIAYGHHRMIALEEEFGKTKKVDLIVRNLNDDQMLKIMARENMEDWATSAVVEQETIRAVVEAYAEGKIELGKPTSATKKEYIRYAPSFAVGGAPSGRSTYPYTIKTLADFIGWTKPNGTPQDKVSSALNALELIEQKILNEKDFAGLGTMQAQAVVKETRKVKKDLDVSAKVTSMTTKSTKAVKEAQQKAKETAAKVGKALSQKMKDKGPSGIGYRQAGEAAQKIIPRKKKEQALPHIDKVAEKMERYVFKVFGSDDPNTLKMVELTKYAEHIGKGKKRILVSQLRKLAKRCNDFADAVGLKRKSLPRKVG